LDGLEISSAWDRIDLKLLCGAIHSPDSATVSQYRVSYMSKRLTAIIQAEPPGFVALCPELDVASQGDTIEQSLANF
jgi:hypothetical protein